MLRLRVAQNPTFAVSAGKNACQNWPTLGPPCTNWDGVDNIGPKPPAFVYAQASNATDKTIKIGALYFSNSRILSIPFHMMPTCTSPPMFWSKHYPQEEYVSQVVFCVQVREAHNYITNHNHPQPGWLLYNQSILPVGSFAFCQHRKDTKETTIRCLQNREDHHLLEEYHTSPEKACFKSLAWRSQIQTLLKLYWINCRTEDQMKSAISYLQQPEKHEGAKFRSTNPKPWNCRPLK